MISASGREVATTCQYSPVAGSLVTDARAAGCEACGFGWGALVSFAGGEAGCPGCVAAGSDGAGLVSAGGPPRFSGARPGPLRAGPRRLPHPRLAGFLWARFHERDPPRLP